jgi:hypothetical protein
MAEIYKILGQLNPGNTAEYVLYTSQSSGYGTIITNITVVNLSGSGQNFDINVYNSVVSNGTTSPALNNVYKNYSIPANTSMILQPGILLAPNNTLVVRGSTNLTFSAYGVEITT